MAPAFETSKMDTNSSNDATASASQTCSGDAGIQTSSPATVVQETNTPTTDDTTSNTFIAANALVAPSSEDDARSLNIGNVTLRFNTIDEALSDGLMGRDTLSIQDDDVSQVKNSSSSKAWVKKLVEAFDPDHLATPEDETKQTLNQKVWFERWQGQAHSSVASIFEKKGLDHVEKSCWFLFDAVIKVHELGAVSAGSTLVPSIFKCSERLAFIVSILEKYALVRLDVLRSEHIDALAASPEAFINRKIINCWNNMNRAEKAKTAAGRKATASATVKKRSSGKATQQTSQEEQDPVETPVKNKKGRKTRLTGAIESAAKATGESPDKGQSSAKRTHSATDHGTDEQEPASQKRLTSLKLAPTTEDSTLTSSAGADAADTSGGVAAGAVAGDED